jgi:hypothetical protein
MSAQGFTCKFSDILIYEYKDLTLWQIFVVHLHFGMQRLWALVAHLPQLL